MSTNIDRDELLAELSRSDPPQLVEALGGAYFASGHLPGALNIPAGQVDLLAPRLLPDQSAPVVVYCSGTCDRSRIVADRLEALGYQRVRIYAGGKEDWVANGLAVDQAPDRD